MKIAVIGAGALGGTFATLLARAGHEVTVTARGLALAVIRAEGISLTGGFGRARQHPLALERLVETPDLALICTKAQDAAAAIAENAAVLDGAAVIVVQNGLDGVNTARSLLPHSECFGALSIIAANYSAPGRVTITTAAPTYLGRGDGAADAATNAWRDVLAGAVPTVGIDNFVGAQWTKLVVNMLNALPAITGLSVQEVVDDAGLRRVMTSSMRETVRVGMRRGVRFGSLQGLGDRQLRAFSRLPLALGQVLPLRMRRRMGDVPNLGSTLQSLKRGQITEIDFLNGAVVREAGLAGVRAPVNALLTALVHEVETRGVPLAPVDVLERFAALAR
ncbi:ketopantoate reductase family protein [Cryobacterium sp. TMT1-21]|uniref:2-dehydropantoate 2-reductase n=1 Tax=Cryobacterium shii TaxID=1259235 RepID=A0AAQ2C791_9MICO|nr:MULTISPECIES: 2-dehydropantoate 2-reductase [Cryobacterium]TFC50156.1 ketopantoate reductase family protein [Cryobacterium shii]TFC82508.1 ketopantoate reductase family protein [Cryobacterium sp. TmT2-59]TFD15284.1 ketopantoate reductase family protein [Cryobacterium sp. TMT4-10]TFD18107.1 ketopantoate reductase family protein [Cryobacterium sp. TMT1-21]TFD25024.1 ketopantoate reductase family protein [Cryobacterium sp. TMT2-23]